MKHDAGIHSDDTVILAAEKNGVSVENGFMRKRALNPQEIAVNAGMINLQPESFLRIFNRAD